MNKLGEVIRLLMERREILPIGHEVGLIGGADADVGDGFFMEDEGAV